MDYDPVMMKSCESLNTHDEFRAIFDEFLAEQRRKLEIVESAKESTNETKEPNLNAKRKRSPELDEESDESSGHSTTVSDFSSEEEPSSSWHLKKKKRRPALYKLKAESRKRKKSHSVNPSEDMEVHKSTENAIGNQP